MGKGEHKAIFFPAPNGEETAFLLQELDFLRLKKECTDAMFYADSPGLSRPRAAGVLATGPAARDRPEFLASRPEKLGSRAHCQNTAVFISHSLAKLQNIIGVAASHIIYATNIIFLPHLPSQQQFTKGSLFSASSKSALPTGGNGRAITRRRLSFTGCQSRNMGGIRVSAGNGRSTVCRLQKQCEWFSSVR